LAVARSFSSPPRLTFDQPVIVVLAPLRTAIRHNTDATSMRETSAKLALSDRGAGRDEV